MITFLLGIATGTALTTLVYHLAYKRALRLEQEEEQKRKLHDLYNVTRLESQTRRGFGRHS